MFFGHLTCEQCQLRPFGLRPFGNQRRGSTHSDFRTTASRNLRSPPGLKLQDHQIGPLGSNTLMLNNTIRESTKKAQTLVSYFTEPLLAIIFLHYPQRPPTQLQQYLAPICWACLQVLTGSSLTHSSWKPHPHPHGQDDRPNPAPYPHLSRPGPFLSRQHWAWN